MAFLTYAPTTEDKQTENKKLYQIKSGLSIIKAIIPKVLTLTEKQEIKQDPTTTCIYFKCFKSFGDLNSLLKENNLKKKQLKEKCRICSACHAFI